MSELRTYAGQPSERGNPCTYLCIKIRFWSLPKRAEKSVKAISWNWKRTNVDRTKHRSQEVHRRENLPVDRQNVGKVISNQPKRLRFGVPCENDHAVLCDACTFLKPPPLRVPMVDCQNSEYGVEGAILEWQ